MNYIQNNSDVVEFFGEYPITAASIRVTMGCNALCKHCYTDAGKKLSKEFTTQEIKDIIDQLSDMNVFQLFFTGGEPFLRKDIVELLNYANEKGIEVLISTNGSLLNEDLLERIKHVNFRQFQISIDGIETYHDANRGKGFFHKAEKAIDLLKKYNIKNITVGTCVSRENISQISDLLMFVLDKKIEKFAFMLLLPEGRASKNMDVDPKELVKNLEDFWSIYRNNEITFEFAENSVLPPILVPEDLREKGVHKKFSLCCSYPNLLGIGANGDVAPCDGFLGWKEFIGGNIYKNNLKEIWLNMLDNKNIFPENIMDIGGVCSKCTFYYECAGNCRADSISYYNSLSAPYPICQKLYEENLFPKECLKND